VGATASVHRMAVLPADRGARQYQKLMQLLAAVDADGTIPLIETLVRGLPRLRRGMTAVVVTPSLERDWIRPLATLRSRGVSTIVCLLDPVAFDDVARREDGRPPPLEAAGREDRVRAQRAVRHALAEHDLPVYAILPERPLGEILVSRGPAGRPVRV